jgi:hypothetical protein
MPRFELGHRIPPSICALPVLGGYDEKKTAAGSCPYGYYPISKIV